MKGRFAPSPSGRMHMGNVFTALISWLSVRKQGGKWLLRIEDLDPQRSKAEYAHMIEDDLAWLGLEWDEGGMADGCMQSLRGEVYAKAMDSLRERGLLYRCRCTRADIMATQAPHQSDGRVVYAGTCRPGAQPPFVLTDTAGAVRLYVPDREVEFTDVVYGRRCVNLGADCGDFIVRRADRAWAYQLAVTVDDALMGVTEVVRGCDLLLSTAPQMYLASLLGYATPVYAHLPLLLNGAGQRLSKRDGAMAMDALRERYTSRQLLGRLAFMAGLLPEPDACGPADLVEVFDWEKVRGMAARQVSRTV